MVAMNIVKRMVWRALDSFPLLQVVRAFDLVSYNRLGRRGMLDQAFEFVAVNQVPGDYFEFGVWRGTTFSFAHRLKRKMGPKMKMWAFDSFEGLPPVDDTKFNVFTQGEYSCSEAEFRTILRRHGVRNEEYEIVRGYYRTASMKIYIGACPEPMRRSSGSIATCTYPRNRPSIFSPST